MLQSIMIYKKDNPYIFLLVCLLIKTSMGVPLANSIQKDDSFTSLVIHEDPVDMGVDMTDGEAPEHLRRALVNATLSDDYTMNQYSEGMGKPRLLKAIARLYSKLINRELDPKKNVLATVGATEALFDALRALTKPGDEWIIIEPFWSKFEPMVKINYGIPRFATLKLNKTEGEINGNDWILDKKEFENLINNKTRGILLNNPNNPTGKVYSLEDLEFIADLAKKHDLFILSDETHEWIVYEPYKLTRIASLPGMFERTITVGSGSKTFTIAGWRVGWAYGPANLIDRMNYVHDYAVQSTGTPQQIAVAVGFEHEFKYFGQPESYFVKNTQNVTYKRDFIVSALREAGLQPVVPNGGYCLLASWPSPYYKKRIDKASEYKNEDTKFADWFTDYVGIMGFPGSDYYGTGHSAKGKHYIRFCFQKRMETLEKARENLLRLRSQSFI